MIKKLIINIVIFTSFKLHGLSDYDLTLVGSIKFAESLARITIGVIDSLNNSLKINYISTRGSFDLTGLPENIKRIALSKNKKPGNVALLMDGLWYLYSEPHKFVPNSLIKIAYSMVEADTIPQPWVQILNSKFDAVVVPDDYFQEVYLRSGVKIPIFTLPIGMYIEELLNMPAKKNKNNPFIFGMSAALWPRKNQDLLIKAFSEEFGNNQNVKLILHARDDHADYKAKIYKLLEDLNVKNIEIIMQTFSHQEHCQFLKSLDCYVNIAKGEGFSLTPREALALGIPCIISNNTAHKTICRTNLVYSVLSNIAEPADTLGFGNAYGSYFNCNIDDVKKALREVYNNYYNYLAKAGFARVWVSQYLYRNLSKKYINLIKPKKVLLSNKNIITDEFIMTNSKSLYEKYMKISKLKKKNR